MQTHGRVNYWLEIADNDLSAVESLIKGKNYLQAGFFCHLIVEKALKAAIEHNTGEIPPKIHKLKVLAKQSGIIDTLSEEQLSLLDELDPLQLEARYPEYRAVIAKTLTKEKLQRIYEETRGFLCWIKQQLGKLPEDTPTKSEKS